MEGLGRKRTSGLADLLRAEAPKTKRRRLFQTCEWIDSEPAFQKWLSGAASSPLLWIHGPSGSGKSFLSQYILDKLDNDFNQAAALSYFCNEHSSPDSILRSLFMQMVEHTKIGEDARLEISLALEEALGVSAAPFDASYRLWDSLQMARNLTSFTIIIDGLDEVASHYLDNAGFGLLARLIQLATQTPATLKLLVSSRENPAIQQALEPFPNIKLTQGKIEGDLKTYITSKVDLILPENVQCSHQELVLTILGKSKGNFLWADLAIKYMVLQGDFEKANLERLTESLDDLYALLYVVMIKTMHTRDKTLLDAILHWTIYSVRPITPLEVANAVAIANNLFLPNIEAHIVNLTQSLVKIEDGVLKPCHFSFRNFILGQHPALGVSFRKDIAHLAIAKSCLKYLLHDSFQSVAVSESITEREALFPLMEYTTLYWIHHASRAKSDATMKGLIKSFFGSNNAFFWFDTLLPAFLERSVLPPPPRLSKVVRFAYFAVLKGQLASYFDESERKEFENQITGWLCDCFERELAIERDWTREPEPSDDEAIITTKAAIQRMLDLSEVYDWLPGKRAQSQNLLQEAFIALRRLPKTDADQSLTLLVYQMLADGLKRAGKYTDAQKVFKDLLQIAQVSLPTQDHRLMFALDGVGWVCLRLNELEDSADYLQRALDIAVQIYGSESPLTLRSKLSLAEVRVKLGQTEEAEALCSQLAAQVREHISNGVPLPRDTISQLNTLAAVYTLLGKFVEAVEVYAVVVEDRTRIFGDEHPMTLWAAMQLGSVKAGLGEVDEALEILRDVKLKQIKVLGNGHPNVQETAELINKLSQSC